MAAWDLAATREDVPLSRLLGGTRSAIASGVSIGIQDSLDAARRQGAQGARGRLPPHQDQDQAGMGRRRGRDDPRRASATIPLMVDANAAYTLADAARLAALDRFELMMIEQPLEYDDIRDHAMLQRRLATPICLDESIHSVRAAEDAIALEACRDHQHQAGPARRPRRVDSRARRLRATHGIPVWHGGMLESGIGRAHNIHLASLPNFTLPGDIAASRRYFVPDLIEPPIEVSRDGTSPCRPRRASASTWTGTACRRRPSRRTSTRLAEPRDRRDARSTRACCATSIRSLAEPVIGGALCAACASAPPAPPPAVPGITVEQKMSWILRLEDQRILRAPAPPPAAVTPPPVTPQKQKKGTPAAPPPAIVTPDLATLAADSEARIRRRAALAIGRVGLAGRRRGDRSRCSPTPTRTCGRWRPSRSACWRTRTPSPRSPPRCRMRIRAFAAAPPKRSA